MQTEELVPLQQFCTYHHVEESFIFSLQNAGLIEIVHTEQEIAIPASQLNELEKMVRLNTEMDINVEGIETITYLLQRIQSMQQEIIRLNNRLRMYEDA
jgi:chaperone modulatory protein CbpM